MNPKRALKPGLIAVSIGAFVFVLSCALLLGCSTTKGYDARLDGTWRDGSYPRTLTYSNGIGLVCVLPATNRAAHGPLGRIEQQLYDGVTNTFRYRIIGRGKDYVDIAYPDRPFRNEVEGAVDWIAPAASDGQFHLLTGKPITVLAVPSDERFHFSHAGKAFWVGEDPASRCWFYRVVSEPGGAADASQPASPEGDRGSGAAGSGR